MSVRLRPSTCPTARPRHQVTVAIPLIVFAPLLMVIVASACRPAGAKGAQVNVIGSTTVLPIAQAAAEEFNDAHPGQEILVQGGGSSAGIEAVADGRAQIGTSSRELKPAELDLGLTDVPIAVDVIAVVVHPANPVSELSLAQLKGIFTGTVTNWREVGGLDEPIGLVNRDEASGTREAFAKKVLEDDRFDRHAAILPGTGQVRAVVASSRDAIGYMSLGYVNDEIKALAVDGVAPTIENVREGNYPLQRTLHFLVKGEPAGLTREYIEFVLSPEVQGEIVSAEFIPISVID